ncbi:competence protein CoiA [Yersinia pseudotuberculosis]|uniref:competence protein CoiA n=1 Tax=Yersinia pseudotuberculosis TaxID=633 RepID=UPI00061C1670|nr:competence protein CoiA family protein [Yersinia pseudotuberculosis]AXY33944.1 competence protein CoiA [Yersinia pseudotuberculosis]AYX09618.1 competence protein CoiA [Yersinia pseudotuberculosis]PEI13523.1 competence protein CoiA [Yersinia pseudotuberculosis]CNJ12444.1 Competence protein [Yersinia pseudotuberculosis]
MLTAKQNEKIIIARDAQKPGVFRCPECDAPVTLRKGKIVAHHFAHKPPITCSYGKGESAEHHRVKLEIFDTLNNHPDAGEVELEKSFGPVRADVSARLDGRRVAFEIQRSAIDFDELHRRTVAYYQLGVSVAWILLPREDLSKGRLSPRKWEIWTHAANMGEAYYWVGNGLVQPITFKKYDIDVPSTDFGGGYSYPSKRYRTPVRKELSHIVDSFTHSMAAPWCRLPYDLPRRRLWKRI